VATLRTAKERLAQRSVLNGSTHRLKFSIKPLASLSSALLWRAMHYSAHWGGDCASTNDGDPIALYDKAADRWVPEIKIVLFGMEEDTDSFLRAVRCGVRGYVLKDASSAEIIAAVQGVVQGEAICPPRLCMSLIQFVSQESRQRSEMTDQRARIKLGLTYCLNSP
jgi:DNA-binding NarL/FixJ family response regulator